MKEWVDDVGGQCKDNQVEFFVSQCVNEVGCCIFWENNFDVGKENQYGGQCLGVEVLVFQKVLVLVCFVLDDFYQGVEEVDEDQGQDVFEFV